MEFWAMWLVIVILLAIIEFSTVNLVSIWFIISGVVAMLTSLFTDNFFIQFGVFAILGLVLMILTKPLLDKMVKEHQEKLNLDRVVGMDGIVTESIKKNMIGEIKVDGKLWSAISSEDIPIDSLVKVERIEGVKLVVKNIEEIKVPVKKVSSTTKKSSTKKTTAKKPVKKTTTKKKVTPKTNEKKASEK